MTIIVMYTCILRPYGICIGFVCTCMFIYVSSILCLQSDILYATDIKT